MGLAGQGGERRRHFREACADVCCHGSSTPAVVFVAGVGLGDGEAEVPLDPGQDCVPYPVRADLLGCHPREMAAEAPPEVVVTPGGDWVSVGVPQQALA